MLLLKLKSYWTYYRTYEFNFPAKWFYFVHLSYPRVLLSLDIKKIEYDISHTYLRAREYGGRYTAKEDF